MTLRGTSETALRAELARQNGDKKRELGKDTKYRLADLSAILVWAHAFETVRLFEKRNREYEEEGCTVEPRVRLYRRCADKAWNNIIQDPEKVLHQYWRSLQENPPEDLGDREGHHLLPQVIRSVCNRKGWRFT